MDIWIYILSAVVLIVGGGLLAYFYAEKVKRAALEAEGKVRTEIKKL